MNWVKFEWEPVTGATGYLILNSAGQTIKRIENGSTVSATIQVDDGRFSIVAFNAFKTSPPVYMEVQSTLSTFLAKPNGFQIVVGTNVVTLLWRLVPGATSYKIYDSQDVLLFTADADDDSAIIPDTTDVYSIRAFNTITQSEKATVRPARGQPPASPTLFVGVFNAGQITFTWVKPVGATGFIIYDPSGAVAKRLGDVATTTLTGEPGVWAILATNQQGQSPPVTTRVSGAVPGVPTNFTAKFRTDGLVQLLWQAASNADGYILYNPAGQASEPLAANAVSAAIQGWDDPGTYSIVAFNLSGQSAVVTATVGAQPATPTNFDGVFGSAGVIVLSWTQVQAATGYDVLGPDGSFLVHVGQVGTATVQGGPGTYKVIAMNNNGSSIPAATVVGVAPEMPTNFEAVYGSAGSIVFSWDLVNGVIGYKLYDDDALVTQVGQVDSVTVQAGPQTYWLVAYNAEGDSEPAELVVLP